MGYWSRFNELCPLFFSFFSFFDVSGFSLYLLFAGRLGFCIEKKRFRGRIKIFTFQLIFLCFLLFVVRLCDAIFYKVYNLLNLFSKLKKKVSCSSSKLFFLYGFLEVKEAEPSFSPFVGYLEWILAEHIYIISTLEWFRPNVYIPKCKVLFKGNPRG